MATRARDLSIKHARDAYRHVLYRFSAGILLILTAAKCKLNQPRNTAQMALAFRRCFAHSV